MPRLLQLDRLSLRGTLRETSHGASRRKRESVHLDCQTLSISGALCTLGVRARGESSSPRQDSSPLTSTPTGAPETSHRGPPQTNQRTQRLPMPVFWMLVHL